MSELDDLNFDVLPAEAPQHVTPDHKVDRPGIFGQRKTEFGPKTQRAIKSKPRKTSPPNRPGQFVEPLTELYMGAALVTMPFDMELSTTIAMQAEKCAEAMDKLAQENEGVRRMLSYLTTASVWGAVIGAHAPILFMILKNHTPVLSRMTENADGEGEEKNDAFAKMMMEMFNGKNGATPE